jgi:hypothetical protein
MSWQAFKGPLAVLIAGQLYLGWALEGPASPLGSLAALALMLAPGAAAALAGGRRSPYDWAVLMCASFGLSSLTVALVVWAAGFLVPLVVASLLGVALAGGLVGRAALRVRPLPPGAEPCSEALHDGDAAARGWPWTLCALLAAAVVLLPFGRIGALTGVGYGFRTYFDHDFLVHLSVVAELAKGDFPPRNPYFGGEPLHYYWLYFLYPTLASRLAGASSSTASTLVQCNFATAALFLPVLYAFLRSHAGRAAHALGGVFVVLLCGSFEGAYVIWRVRSGLLPAHLGEYNVDGVSRWYFAPPQIDALLRGLLYTPQHLWALAILLSLGLVLQRRDRRPAAWWVFALMLPLLGISGFVGVIAVAWVLALVFLDLTDQRARRPLPLLLACLAASALGLALFRGLEMFGTTSFAAIAPQPKTWQHLPTLLFLNFGALGLMGLLGAVLAFRLRARLSSGLLALAAMALALVWHGARTGSFAAGPGWAVGLYAVGLAAAAALALVAVSERFRGGRDVLALLFVGLGAIFSGFIPGYVHEFGLRGGFVVALCLGAFAMTLARRASSWPPLVRAAILGAAVLGAALALPTSAIDLYSTRNLDDPRFSTYVSPREAEALRWIREALPPEAVVQGLPDPVQRRGLIGNFTNTLGERRLAVGKTYYAGQFQIGTERAQARSRAVTLVFRDAPLRRRLEPLIEHDIAFLTIGQPERSTPRADPGFFERRPDLFTRVFDNEELQIYRVDAPAVRRELESLPPPPLAEPEP